MLFLTIGLFCSSCVTEDNSPYQNYYYPWVETQDTVVFVYEEVAMGLGRQYQLMTREQINGDVYVKKEVFNESLKRLSLTREKKIANGFVMKDYVLYSNETDMPFPAEIIEGQMFYFGELDQAGTLVQHFLIKDIDTSAHSMAIIKNLSYGKKGVYELDGKTYPSLSIEVVGEIEDIQSGSITLALKGENIYAEGIGCVTFTQSIENTISHNYQYQGKLDVNEWHKLYEIQR